tara:strand:+ start:50 stop:769 length:720 start_codon:yes stop_codon:yes gene_type:complete
MKSNNGGLFSAPWFKSSLILLVVCALVGYGVSLLPYDEVLNRNWVDVHIRNSGWSGTLVFLAIGAASTAIGAPRQLVAFLAGYAFGFVEGCLLSTLATTLGCIVSFSFSRLVGRPVIRRRFDTKIQRVNQFLTTQPLNKTVIIRLLPVGNNLVTNLVAGVTQVKALPFIVGSFIGYLPQMAIFSLMGKGIVVLSVWKIVLSAGLFVLSAVLSLRLFKQYKAARILDEADNEPEPGSAAP